MSSRHRAVRQHGPDDRSPLPAAARAHQQRRRRSRRRRRPGHRCGPPARAGSDRREIAAAGLRGRGGAGFPTGANGGRCRRRRGSALRRRQRGRGRTSDVQDRMMRRDPYRVVEGAAIAAVAVGADEVYVATKRSFVTEVTAPRRAAVELGESGLLPTSGSSSSKGRTTTCSARRRRCSRRPGRFRCRDFFRRGSRAVRDGVAGRMGGGVVPAVGDRNPTVVSNVETIATAAHSWPAGPSGSGRWAPPSRRHIAAPWSVTSPGRGSSRSSSGRLWPRCSHGAAARRRRAFRAALSGVSNAVLPAPSSTPP